MQAKTEENLKFIQRVEALQFALGASKADTCAQIGLSEAMLSYIRHGRHSVTDKLWAKLDAAERRVKAPHHDETFIGYTRPVPIPDIVAEESGQAPYGKLDGAEFHEAILQIRGLWANLTTDQRADVAHAALHAALSRIESYGQSRKKHNS